MQRSSALKHRLIRRQAHTVRAGDIGEEQVEMPRGAQPVQPPGRIVQAALPLVGEIQIARAVEHQIDTLDLHSRMRRGVFSGSW